MKAHHVRLLAGSIALLAANVSAAVFYVDVNSTNATRLTADWSTAATNIQDAVDAATNGDLNSGDQRYLPSRWAADQ